jgi:flagellar hook-basal body complex protein FliE
MDINPILGPISSPKPILGTQVSRSPHPAGESFSLVLSDALQQVVESQSRADATRMAVAAGEPIELHDMMLAMEESSLMFQLGVSVRNKLVEAYQEITRMQV